MYIYFFAGLALLIAIAFIVKYYVDKHKIAVASKNNYEVKADGVTIIVNDEQGTNAVDDYLLKKPKKDIIISLVFMMICEVCILLGNYVIEI